MVIGIHTDDLEEMANDVCEKNQKIDDLEVTIIEKEKEIIHSRVEYRSQIRSLNREHDEKIENLKHQLATKGEECKELKKDLMSKAKMVDDLESTIIEKDQEITSAKCKIQTFEANLEKLQAHLSEKDIEIQKLKQDYDLLHDENMDLLFQVKQSDDLKNKLNEAKQEMNHLKFENEDMKKKLAQFKDVFQKVFD